MERYSFQFKQLDACIQNWVNIYISYTVNNGMGSVFSFVIVLIYLLYEHTTFQNSDVLQNEKMKNK